MKTVASFLVVCLMWVSATILSADDTPKLTLVSSQRIWNQAPHNAFTDLVRFKDRWFCVFREGKGHVSPDGEPLPARNGILVSVLLRAPAGWSIIDSQNTDVIEGQLSRPQ